MGPVLNKLLELQKQHSFLHGLKQQSRGADFAVVAKEKTVAKLKADQERLTAERKNAQKTADSKELDIKQLQVKIAKFRDQLNTIKTNKEYQTIQNEIKFTEIEQRRLEDQLLAEMEKVEQSVHKVEQAKAAVKVAEDELVAIKAKSAAGAGALEADIRKAERDRADMAREIPHDALEMFDRIASKHHDGALAAITRDEEDLDDEEAYACGGCYMRLTANIYVKVLGTDEIQTCPNCFRILYLEP